MKLITSLILVTIAIFVGACDCSRKTWDCPGFDSPELSGWFPYSNSNLMIYQNSTGQRDTVHLNNLETSAPYTYSGTSRSCQSHRYLESVERMTNGDLKMAIRLGKSDMGGNIYNNAVVTLHNYKPVEFLNVTSSTLGTARFNYSSEMAVQNQSILIVGGRSFNDGVIALRDTVTDKTAGIYKLYIAKNVGVVGYEELPSRSLFVLQ